MQDEKNYSLIENILTQVQLFLLLIKQESRLALACINAIISLLAFKLIIIFSIWINLGLLLGYLFYKLTNSFPLTVSLDLSVNLIFYLFASLLSKYLWNNLFFKATRRQLFIRNNDVTEYN
ncbi:MAG: hypothetical protein A3E87_04405 [Gammaproteobacteria bacterium RIFCSPHIGHO2_12_FULL_35_23]|nr:MAG: hypothetical protein A3E87_04405 [Gammaproteobacteria bacterium RIFCSPHIGHO2_12_FULL_35_23]